MVQPRDGEEPTGPGELQLADSAAGSAVPTILRTAGLDPVTKPYEPTPDLLLWLPQQMRRE